MTNTTLLIDQLCMSPFNVRTSPPDPERDAEMEASILGEGQHNPIICHPLLGQKRHMKWGALGGGRRYRAFKALIARGALPADTPVKISLVAKSDAADLIETSIIENLIRLDLKDHELYAAVARAAANGHDAAQIAANLGKSPALVARWLRLGRLAKPVFAAFASGMLDHNQASAYAATEDTALQDAAFARLSAAPDYQHTPSAIRAALKVGDRQEARLLKLVGDAAYRAAGGAFELDLFADDDDVRGRVVDPPLLDRLADVALTAVRDEARRATGRPALQFRPAPPRGDFGVDYQLQAVPKVATGDGTAEIVLPDGEIVATIDLTESGVPEVAYWWESRKAKFGQARPAPAPGALGSALRAVPPRAATVATAIDRSSPDTAQRADAAIRDADGLIQDGVEIFRSVRRAILRAALVAHPDRGVAADFLVWSQLRLILAQASIAQIGAARLSGASHDPDVAWSHINAIPASKTWADARRELHAQSFLTRDELDEAFLDYRAAPAHLKTLATAVVAGLALERSLAADGYRIAVHDALARELRLDDPGIVREHWTPTFELLERLPAKQRLAIAEPFVERAAFGPWSRLKSAELTRSVLSVVTGSAAWLRAATRDAAAHWVHPLLAFGARDAEGSDAQQAAE